MPCVCRLIKLSPDPLGQVLEHYWLLKQFVSKSASAAAALLLYFEFDDDGSDDFD